MQQQITIFNAKTASSRHLLWIQTEDIFGQQFPFRVHHNKNSSLPEPPPDWTNLWGITNQGYPTKLFRKIPVRRTKNCLEFFIP